MNALEMLRDIAGERYRLVGIVPRSAPADTVHIGREGWARALCSPEESRSTIEVSNCLTDVGLLAEAEWFDGRSGWRLYMDVGLVQGIDEVDVGTTDAVPAVAFERRVKTRGGSPAPWMRYTIYLGFDDDAAAALGQVTILADRFEGFDHGP